MSSASLAPAKEGSAQVSMRAALAPLALALGCATGAAPSGIPAGAVTPARAAPAIETPASALLRPAALHRWIRTILVLEPRAPVPAARLDALVRDLERRLAARSLRARVLRVGGRIAVGLTRTEGAGHPQLAAALGITPALAFRLVDDDAPYLADLARRLRTEDVAAPFHDGYGGAHGVRVAYTTVESVSREVLRAIVARERNARQIPSGRDLLIGPRPDSGGKSVLYLLERDLQVTGEDVADAEVGADAASARPHVLLTFSSAGATKLESLTRANVGRRLAIVLGDEVLSAPVVMAAIAGGRAQVTLGAGPPDQVLQAARDLSLALRAGVLPGPLRLVSIEQRP